MAMDAKEFFARQEATARDLWRQLEKEHAERQKSAPSSTAQTFRVGDPVWVIRPRPMGTHRTKTLFTPGEVVRRIGEDTYRIKVGHGQFWERHESRLRVREPDLRGQHVSLDYAAHEADSDDDYAEQDNYTVEKILAQRQNASAPGGLEFKVRWQGYGLSHDTWEPVSSFVPRINTPFMDYIRKHKTKIHVSDLAALPPRDCSQGRLITALSSPLMHFERLLGRRIVTHLLALFHLPVTCHQSGHIPPPAESGGGWPLSSTPIRHSPHAESLGDQTGRLTLTFPEILGP